MPHRWPTAAYRGRTHSSIFVVAGMLLECKEGIFAEMIGHYVYYILYNKYIYSVIYYTYYNAAHVLANLLFFLCLSHVSIAQHATTRIDLFKLV